MRNSTMSLVVGGGLLACASIVAAQAAQKADQPPRFEDTVVVTVSKPETPLRGGGPSDYFLSFSGPVGVPGVTLTAGTYLFRFPTGSTASGIIQVLKADRSNAYALFMTIPVQNVKRSLSSDAQVVMWRERQAGAPPAIKEWYLPGQTTGYEFVYPKSPA